MTTSKRTFDQLTDAEKEALRKLHEAQGLTSSGPCDLARQLTGDRKLRPSDPASQVYTHLVLGGWIVVRHREHRETIVRYGVSDEYLELMELQAA